MRKQDYYIREQCEYMRRHDVYMRSQGEYMS